jgi:hypothetical protein
MTNIAVYSREQNQLISQTLLPENKKYIPLHFEHKKIKNFNEGDYKNLYIYLVKLCEISGVTKPSGEVLKSIVIFLKETYGDFSQKEIETAFSMAFSFKLDLDDISNYGNINVIWISKILNAYKIKRDKALIEYEKKRRAIDFEKSQEKSKEEIEKYMSQAVISNFEKYKETKKFSDLGNSIFNFASRIKILTLTDKEKQQLMIDANKRLLDNSLSTDKENVFVRALSSLKEGIPVDKARIVARDISVEKLFDKWINEEIDPTILLKKYL